MKKLVVAVIASIFATTAFTQTKSNNALQLKPEQLKHLSDVQALLSAQQNNVPLPKPTGKQQRVIAQVFEQGATGSDSTVYRYSPNAGSQYNYNHILEPGYSSVLAPHLAPACANTYSRPSTDVLADSFITYFNSTCYYRSGGSYNSNTKLDSFYRFDVGNDFENEEWSYIGYNADGLVDTLINTVSGIDGSRALVYLRSITYNNKRQVVEDKGYYNQDGTWMDMQRFYYHYNGAGCLDTLTSIGTDGYSEQTVFTYDTEGRLTGLKLYGLSETGNYQHYLTDTFSYSTGTSYITSFEERYFNEGEPEGGLRITLHPGANGKPESIVAQILVGENWVVGTKGTFTYNAYGNPSSIQFIEQMSGETSSLRFHYESY